MAVPTSWQEGRNSIVILPFQERQHIAVSFILSLPFQHQKDIGLGFRVILPALRTQHIAWARCGHQAVRGRQAVRINRYIQARAWQYKFHHLTYLREARFAYQLAQNLRH